MRFRNSFSLFVFFFLLVIVAANLSSAEVYFQENASVSSDHLNASSSSYIQQNSSVDSNQENTSTSIACADSDGGLNYYAQGTVKTPAKTNTDYCAVSLGNGNFDNVASCDESGCFLFEYYCNANFNDQESENNQYSYNLFACPNGCLNGACIQGASSNIASLGENTSIMLDNTSSDIIASDEVNCNGCLAGRNCYQFGYRNSGEYCSNNNTFVAQLESNAKCDNNFQCGSNLCVSGKCISPGLIENILSWFKRLFGNQ